MMTHLLNEYLKNNDNVFLMYYVFSKLLICIDCIFYKMREKKKVVIEFEIPQNSQKFTFMCCAFFIVIYSVRVFFF